ncbi:alpha/beta fold hydrolase [Streptomyces sp. PA03-1a]|nr:alpha/beta fold hydrolase [Streptomyces sp. PA03-1a]MDX2819293.1 alpha/beta fold hydrolase [Streptomyces sp. PA03-5A]
MYHATREGRALCRGAELAFEEAGEGPLAVYAHGGFVSRAVEDRMGLFDWGPVLHAGRRLVRYDARGHGRSTGAAVDTDYTYVSLAGDLLDLLDHLAAREPVAAMGASMGCGTVLHAAVRAPDRFSHLVLLLPPTAWGTRAAYARNNRRIAARIEREGVQAWPADKRRHNRPAVVADVPELPPTPVEWLLPAVLRGLAMSDLPAPPAVAALRLPVLILAWVDDPGHPLVTAETLLHLMPAADLHVSRTRRDVRAWGERIAAFLTDHPA